MIGAHSDSTGTDVSGSESVARDKSSGSATRLSKGVKSVSGSIATKSAASMAGSIPPLLDGAICSRLTDGVVADAISRTLFDGRVTSCSPQLCGTSDMGPNPSKIKSPRMSAVYFKFPNLNLMARGVALNLL